MNEEFKVFDKIIGYDDEKKALLPICDMMRHPDKYAKLGVVMPSGALLQGDPGYGKTLMAKCFIEACGVKSFVCRKDKADGDFMKYLKQCFDDAEKEAPAIVFLDDMDKFANADSDHKNAEEYVAVQSCIDNVKGKNVFVIATTNELHNLPDSLLRPGRFDINLEMCGLDKENQIKLIEHYLKGKPYVEINPEEIWKIVGGSISCAELESIINDAAMSTTFENREVVSREDIVFSCLKFKFGGVISNKPIVGHYKELVAYHEAGHTIVDELLRPNCVNLVSIKQFKAAGAGVTCTLRDEANEKFIGFKKNLIIGALAGKAATEVVFNEIDPGARSDLEKARDALASLRDGCAYLGLSNQLYDWPASETRAKGEEALNRELEKLYLEAKSIVFDNRQFLDAVAKALLEKETIFIEDIQEIKKSIYGGV